MKLKNFKKDYHEFSKLLSENNRKLAFAGIAPQSAHMGRGTVRGAGRLWLWFDGSRRDRARPGRST